MKRTEQEIFLLDNLKMSDGLSEKEKEVTDYFDASYPVFEKCNKLFNDGTAFLQAGAGSGLPAPIPAWKEGRVSQSEIDKGLADLLKMMKDATPLLDSISVMQDQYDSYC